MASDYVLNGAKQFISGAGDSRCLRHHGQDRRGRAERHLHHGRAEGRAPALVLRLAENKMGWHMQSTRQLIFEDCKVPAEKRPVGRMDRAFASPWRGSMAAGSTSPPVRWAAAAQPSTRQLSYAGERQAFGQTIDRFQALQFKLADMETDLQGPRACCSTPPPHAWMRKPTTPANGSGHGQALRQPMPDFDVANDALQIHGGYGLSA